MIPVGSPGSPRRPGALVVALAVLAGMAVLAVGATAWDVDLGSRLGRVLIAAGCVVATVVLARRDRCRRDGPWTALAVGTALLAVGQSVSVVRGLGVNAPVAGIQDVPVLLAVPCAVVAAVRLSRGAGTRGRGTRAWLDAVLVASTVGVLGSLAVTAGLGGTSRPVDPLVAVGYPVVGAFLCATGMITLAAAPAPRRAAAAWLLAAWIVLTAVLVAGAVAAGLDSPGLDLLATLGWTAMLGLGLVAAAVDPGPAAEPDDGPAELPVAGLLLGFCSAFGVGALLTGAAAVGLEVPLAVAVGAVVLVLLAFARSLLWAVDATRSTRRLAGTEAFFRTLVLDADEITVVLDRLTRVAWVSDRVATLLGHRPAELVGRQLAALVHPGDLTALRSAVAGSRGEHLLRLRTSAGAWCELVSTGTGGATSQGRVLHLRTGGERYRAERELHRMAFTDHLTGLPNRARLTAALTAAVDREGASGSVLLLDLDGFKAVNDVAGHEAGDRLLVEVADLLRAQVREPDLVARIGGDEFAVLVRSGPTDAAGLAARMVAALDREHRALGPDGRPEGPVFAVAGSIGVAEITGGLDGAAVLRRADLALRAAKAAGKNCVRVHGDALDLATTRRTRLARDLPAAVGSAQLRVVYQPIVGTVQQQVIGLEALVRWDHPVFGEVGPEEFVPLAEDDGLVVALQRWVLDTACRHAAWLRQQGCQVNVGVNISVRHLQAGCLVPDVGAALGASGLPASALVLEITESVLVTDDGRVARDLRTLRDTGCAIALDDFGRGYSSFAYLARLPVQVLKMDREFLAGVEHDPRSSAVVGSVVDLGRRLGIDVVAEGVESEGQLAALRELGCSHLQGYLFAPPVEADRVLDVVAAVDASLAGRPTERIASSQ